MSVRFFADMFISFFLGATMMYLSGPTHAQIIYDRSSACLHLIECMKAKQSADGCTDQLENTQ